MSGHMRALVELLALPARLLAPQDVEQTAFYRTLPEFNTLIDTTRDFGYKETLAINRSGKRTT